MTTTVSIEGKLRGEVEKEAGPLTAKGSAEVTGGFSQSYTKATEVRYESRHFLVIPPGFSFCAFTNNTSVSDVHSTTGFRWKCSFPEYIQSQEQFHNGRWTPLEICRCVWTDPGRWQRSRFSPSRVGFIDGHGVLDRSVSSMTFQR